MKYYLVGTPEPVYTNVSIFSIEAREFTKEEIEKNLKETPELRIFTRLKDAREYARSLRICRASPVPSPAQKQIAPVVYVDLKPKIEKYESLQTTTEEVTVKEYEGLHHNQDKGEHRSTLSFVPTSDVDFDLNDFIINAVEFPDTGYPITKFNQISLSFFRALNPTSPNSGIVYSLAGNYPCQGKEMLDSTVKENILSALDSDLDLLAGLNATFNILVGEHFDLSLKGRDDNKGGAKGLLDFLILPLLARKLIADTQLDERKDNTFTNVLALAIAVPIEIARFSAGLALTILLIPTVMLVHLIKACLPAQEATDTSSFSEQDMESMDFPL